ncbi:MAG: alpha/beta hydrolase, partial [Gammaproteobacteria bacterium]
MKKTILLLILMLTGCMPAIHPPGEKIQSGRILTDRFVTEDGSELRLRSWLPGEGRTRAVIIALHGFNDYSRFFEQPAAYFSSRGIACYAYDQRGFGESPNRGLWAGIEAYAEDAASFARLVRSRHPGAPVYLLGESMGGAVAIVASSQPRPADFDGVILAAPAVWNRKAMPWYQRALLWTLAHTLPWLTLTGEGVEVTPSDNIEMLKALGRDPLVIKESRVETLYGLANLMDAAFAGAEDMRGALLMLYGEKDDIIPKEPIYRFVHNLEKQDSDAKDIAIYENGYHMLLRDLQAEVYWKDIENWIFSPLTP